ncbi:MAG: hypothetical protein LBN23_06610 [Paludibacter sp.]|jgi:hypothetical protein|nr:hypothetical protein [Paludibacter sp.]
MKKIIIISISALMLIAIIYVGIVKDGFRYFTGIGTPYSYFQAQKAKNDSILIVYMQNLEYYVCYVNYDSLRLQYGFKEEFGGLEVSSSILHLYNSVIYKEIECRLGEDKLKEYGFKLDSLQEDCMSKSPLFHNKLAH